MTETFLKLILSISLYQTKKYKIKMLQQSRNDLPFECFQMEAVNVLTSLASYHETKKRQIDRVFNVLFDNLPEELKKASINDTLEKMLSLARKKLTEEIPENPGSGIEEDIAENHRDIVEDSISDYCDDKLVQFFLISDTFISI